MAGGRAKPTLHFYISFGFVLLAGLLGAGTGRYGSFRTLVMLCSILLVHESARALLARAFGRSSRVSITIAGGQTDFSGPRLPGGLALGLASIGSVANVLVAVVLGTTAQRAHEPALATFLHQAAFGHAIWGIAQALPLAPFRLGAELARHLPPSLRRTHAIASGGLAVGAVVAIFNLPKIPLLRFALAFVALSAVRTAYDALQEDRDERSGVVQKSSDASARLAAGSALQAITLARAALEDACSLAQRRKLWKTLAWSGIDERDPFLTHLALQHLSPADIDLHLLSSYLSCCNRGAEAEELLREARNQGYRSAEASKLLIELLFARGDHAGALALAEADSGLLSAQDRSALAAAFLPELLAQTPILTAS
ncbi:MAG TPA: hypothetical protein VGF76_25550 [Polyangiaceae bacterium]